MSFYRHYFVILKK